MYKIGTETKYISRLIEWIPFRLILHFVISSSRHRSFYVFICLQLIIKLKKKVNSLRYGALLVLNGRRSRISINRFTLAIFNYLTAELH